MKKDTAEFFDMFGEAGFLSKGESFEECNSTDNTNIDTCENVETAIPIVSSDCSKNFLNQNDLLRSLHIEIANECNERCVHCYIPHEYKGKEVKEIGEKAFAGCDQIESVQVRAYNVTIKTFAFESCSSLRRISFSGGVNVESYAFSNCPKLFDFVAINTVLLGYS